MLAPSAPATADIWHPGAEGDGTVLPVREEADRPSHQPLTQIMMRSKERPRRCLAANEAEGDGGPPLKRPPGEATLGGAIDPVGLQPRLDVLVTGDRHELLIPAAHAASQGRAAHLRDGTIDRAGELVHDDGL